MARTNVSFRFATEFIGAKESEDILGVSGVDWFIQRLRRIPELSLAADLIQEDWGVAVQVERRGKRFWIGVSVFGEDTWIAHVHHPAFSVFQRLSHSGRRELHVLAADLHAVLVSDAAVSDVRWYRDRDLRRPPFVWARGPENA